ncbi:hypothetical protein BJ508DRAFT_415038 [Ascobolus immersus RN42]|uniref:Uncharacterized protein n=1 Tax=Ascobolus immersus RN42 TaxID=1160509 RepID=A0A3N4IA49_ASCIM|nr:hypothetical protein BJ508DRAFT_415038 [Ascobolus immersus RN42]
MSLITGGGSSFSMPLGNFYVRRQEVNQDECNKSCFEDFKKDSECTTGTDEEKKRCACKNPAMSSDKFKNCASGGTHKVCNVDNTAKAGLEALKFYWSECQPFLKDLGEDVKKEMEELGKNLEDNFKDIGEDFKASAAEVGKNLEETGKNVGNSLAKAITGSDGATTGVVGVKKLVVVGLLAWGALAML